MWLLDYHGAAVGVGTPEFRTVEPSGRLSVQGAGPPESAGLGLPALGTRGGHVVFETGAGAAYWDVGGGVVSGRTGSPNGGPISVADAVGDRIVWCQDQCTRLVVHAFAGTTPFRAFRAPAGTNGFDERNARLSPDTSLVAAGAGARIAVYDTRNGRRRAVIDTRMDASGLPARLEWSADGKRLFFTSDSYARDTTTVGEYVVATGKVHVRTIPVGGLLSGTTLAGHDARELLRAPLGAPDACLAPTIALVNGPPAPPSGRPSACGFRF